MSNTDDKDRTLYHVVLNHEEQYSIYPAERQLPLGWKTVGDPRTRDDCLRYISEVWVDMRPLSLRQAMAER